MLTHGKCDINSIERGFCQLHFANFAKFCRLHFAIFSEFCQLHFAIFAKFCRLHSTNLYLCRRKAEINTRKSHGNFTI